jgi:hypothetical protein
MMAAWLRLFIGTFARPLVAQVLLTMPHTSEIEDGDTRTSSFLL